MEDDQIYRFDDLTQEQKKKLEQKLIEQVENVPLRLAEEAQTASAVSVDKLKNDKLNNILLGLMEHRKCYLTPVN